MDFSTTTNPLDHLDTDGIIVGVYKDQSCSLDHDSLKQKITNSNFSGKKNKTRLFFGIDNITSPIICLVGLGDAESSDAEDLRIAVAIAAKTLQAEHCTSIAIQGLGNPKAVAEGLSLGLYSFDELKEKQDNDKNISKVILSGSEDEFIYWSDGLIVAESQNKARRLGELPANIATPSYFVSEAEKYFADFDTVTVTGYDEQWATEQKMGAFLSVAKGSDEPARFLVLNYRGGNDTDQPLALVGKGITFDTGGINIKSAAGMYEMRADCTGAAVVIGTVYGIAKLKLPLNVVGIAPLTENMPSGKASRPSDVVVASNGKSIEIGNTDAEGRLVLSDGLVYVEKTFNPHTIIDIATLTGAMARAIGAGVYLGALSRSDELWNELNIAGNQSGEQFWRFPLDKRYEKSLKSHMADVKSTGGNPGQITAALYLGNFVNMERWAHLDIAGSAVSSKAEGYKPKGNTGVSVRALIQLAKNYVSN